jgi:hypothetical protein
MTHEITVRSGTTTDTIKATGGIFIVAYDSPADGEKTGRATTIIRATPKDTARAMLGQDGLNGRMMRQFAKGLCDAMYTVLKADRTR